MSVFAFTDVMEPTGDKPIHVHIYNTASNLARAEKFYDVVS